MSKWVIRNDCAARRVGVPKECFDPDAKDGSFEFPSIEEGVRSLLGAGETAVGSSRTRDVMMGASLVGHIEIRDTSPGDALTS